jgi:hypothetical protein
MGTKVGWIWGLMIALALVVAVGAWSAPAAGEETAAIAEGQGGVCETGNGIAYFSDDRVSEVWITLGSRDGLRPQARIAFVRNGEAVAEGEVVTVREVDAVVRVDSGTPGGTILCGDKAQVLENGSREAADVQLKKEARKSAFESIFFSGLFAYLIML